MTTENKCPALRADLPPMIDRIAALERDERGYPVPFLVAYVNGKAEFRMADPKKRAQCVRYNWCWVCGQPLGQHKTFVIGPMCAVNRNTAEPPCHLDCSEWSVKSCPFLCKPQMVRREDELTRANEGNVAGLMIKRNPGVICLWTTKQFNLVRDQGDGLLFSLGNPTAVSWWHMGKPATLAQVEESISSGVPFLLNVCESQEEKQTVFQALKGVKPWLPNADLPL